MDPLSTQGASIGAHRSIPENSSKNSPISDSNKAPEQGQSNEKRVNLEAKKLNAVFSFLSSLFQKKSSKPNDLQNKRFQYLTSGKAKDVYEDKKSDKFVYYTPVAGISEKIFGRKKAEIKAEVRIATDVKNALAEIGLEGESHIATELIEVPGSDNLEGQYVVQALKAGEKGTKYDLDQLLQGSLQLEERFDLCEQILKGLSHLHQRNYVHGDLKGNNILHFKESMPNGETKSILRLTDFGKTRKIKEGGSVLHTGNPRLAAPEGRTSTKSEVFSAALLLVGIMEEEVLQKENKDMVIKPGQLKSDQAGKNLRGIVKFVVTNNKCVQTDSKNISGKIRLIAGAAKAIRNIRGEREKTSSEETKKYIQALFTKLREEKSASQENGLEAIEKLLISMVDEDPSKRPSTSEALVQFENALEIYNGGIAS